MSRHYDTKTRRHLAEAERIPFNQLAEPAKQKGHLYPKLPSLVISQIHYGWAFVQNHQSSYKPRCCHNSNQHCNAIPSPYTRLLNATEENQLTYRYRYLRHLKTTSWGNNHFDDSK